MSRPHTSEYIPATSLYVELVPDGSIPDLLAANKGEVISLFQSIPGNKEDFRYAPGKWSIKETLLHLSDAERVFGYRALTLGRGDTSAVFPNMNENMFAANADTANRSLADIIREFSAVRDSSLFLFRNLSNAQQLTQGSLFGHPVTPRGFGYLMIGHALHHINIIRNRYLS